jgi:hypothetical protein
LGEKGRKPCKSTNEIARIGILLTMVNKRKIGKEMMAIRAAIRDILQADHPQTVRQVFYQLVARGVIEKTEAEYKGTVIRLLTRMRLADQIPWEWIIDETRRSRVTYTFDNVRDALRDAAQTYRRSALRESDVYIEIWSEKEALAGIIYEAASEYDVPVEVSKGMPSLTQVWRTACAVINATRAGKQCFIYQFGDHDPTGCLIPKTLEKRLREFCAKHDCECPTVERIALTPEQIREYRLPTRPTKREGNSHARDFRGRSVELDALPSRVLRQMVTDCIERHINPTEVNILRVAEESERDQIAMFARRV